MTQVTLRSPLFHSALSRVSRVYYNEQPCHT